MRKISEFYDKFIISLDKVKTVNEEWQFLISLAILFLGFFFLEIFWRYLNKRAEKILERKNFKEWIPYISGFLPSLRLACAVLLIRIAELPLVIPPRLVMMLHGLEVFLLAIAGILFVFSLVRLLDLSVSILPAAVKKKIPEAFLKNFKGILRITGIIFVIILFVYSQKTFFPEWLWKSSWWRYVSLIIVYMFLYIGGNFLTAFLDSMTYALKDAEEKIRLRLFLKSALWPIRLLLLALAVYATQAILLLPAATDQIAEIIMNILGTLAIVIFLYQLLNVVEYELTKFVRREDNEFDMNLVQMVRIVTRALIVVFGFIYILKAATGKPMTTLLAGLGIGGLAVALAAQDTLKNLFGSLMIMLDKPFTVGDRVVAEGFDGYIEEIGFRCTRLRTFPGHLISIPNEKMASVSVENIAQRPSIRRLTNITITYDTPPDKVERALSIIKETLKDHEGMRPDYPPRVYFNEFNDTSLNIVMFYWYHPPDYWNFMEFSERVNLQIMRAFEAEGIEFAFPTTTTYLAQDDRRPLTINVSSQSKHPDLNEKG